MPFYSSTKGKARALGQRESKTKAAALLLGRHTNKLVNRVGDTATEGLHTLKRQNAAVPLGHRQAFLEIAQTEVV